MCSDEIVVSANGLSKTYRQFVHAGDRVKQFFSLGTRRYHKDFAALRDVSFDIRKGQSVGIIGRNGSGKSTLLQLICGILRPTTGRVTTKGRVSALLELGAGFNPEFTGRENVFFQGAIMGLHRTQVESRFGEIAAFAEIGDFIDRPVRTYSSGMFVRLAFAVAVSVDPDLLVVDEALAVGDAVFQAKCLRRIDDIRQRGGTVILVSHAVEQVAHHCDRAILLNKGIVVADGDVSSTLQRYVQQSFSLTDGSGSTEADSVATRRAADPLASHPWYRPEENRWGDGRAAIESVTVLQNGCADPEVVTPFSRVEVRLMVRFLARVERPIYGLTIKSTEGVKLLVANSRDLLSNRTYQPQSPGDHVTLGFRFDPALEQGRYLLSVGIADFGDSGIEAVDRRYDALVMRVDWSRQSGGSVLMNPEFTRTFD